MMIKLVSNKDGEADSKIISFSSYAPCTYIIVKDGTEVGTVELNPNYDLSNLNPIWRGADKVWMAFDLSGDEITASQHLGKVRTTLKEIFK